MSLSTDIVMHRTHHLVFLSTRYTHMRMITRSGYVLTAWKLPCSKVSTAVPETIQEREWDYAPITVSLYEAIHETSILFVFLTSF